MRAHLTLARSGKERADELIATTDKALEALHFSPILRFSPFRRGRRERVARYGAAVRTLAGAMEHVRTAQRAAWQARRRPALDIVDEAVWVSLGEALTRLVRAYEGVATGSDAGLPLARSALQQAFAMHGRAVAQHPASQGDLAMMDRAAVLAEIEHVLEELSEQLRVDSPNTSAVTRPLAVLRTT